MLVYQRVISLYKTLLLLILFFWGGDSSGKFVRIPMMCGLLIAICGLSGPSNHQPNPIQLGQLFHLKGWVNPLYRTSPLWSFMLISHISNILKLNTVYDHITYPPQTFLVRWLTHFTTGLQSPKNLKLDKIRPDLTAPSSTRPVLSTAIKGALTSPQQRLAKSIQCLMKEDYPPGKKHNPPKRHLWGWLSFAPGGIHMKGKELGLAILGTSVERKPPKNTWVNEFG